MSREIESVLPEVVRELAAETRAADGLAVAAVARGRRLRLRRRIGGTLAAVVAATAIATPFVLLRPPPPGTALTPTPSTSPVPSVPPSTYPGSTGPTTLPEAKGVPGAAEQPPLVGADPAVLHFDVDLSIFPDPGTPVWRSSSGVERFTIGFADGGFAQRDLEIYVAQREPQDLRVWGVPAGDGDLHKDITVHGRPVTLRRYPAGAASPRPYPPSWVLRWQPVHGLWVVIVARDGTDEIMRRVAETLRLDRAEYCAQPLVASVVPEDARLTACWVSIRAKGAGQTDSFGAWESSGFTIANSRGATLMVGFGPKLPVDSLVGTKDEFRPNRTVGGYPAMWRAGPYQRNLWVNGYQGKFDLGLTTELNGFAEAEVLAVAEGLRVAGDLNNPDSWPTRRVP